MPKKISPEINNQIKELAKKHTHGYISNTLGVSKMYIWSILKSKKIKRSNKYVRKKDTLNARDGFFNYELMGEMF